MANPYFNAAYYLANNPDLDKAGVTLETAEQHYLNHGAAEAAAGATSRNPVKWFDVKYYLESHKDLVKAGITASTAFQHFADHGMNEGLTPNASIRLNETNLGEYAAANEDLRKAFGIADGAKPTAAQLQQLTQHFYQHGINEERAGKPDGTSKTPGETFTLTTGADVVTGTDKALTVEGVTAVSPTSTTLNSFDKIQGGTAKDTLKVAMGADFAGFSGTGFLKGVENVDLTVEGPVARTFNATNVEGVEAYNLTGNVNLAQLSSVAAAVNLGARTADATIGLVGNALVGATDTLNLGVKDVGTATAARTVEITGTSASNALENVAINATGANNVALKGTTSGVKTVVASGDGALSLKVSEIGATTKGLTSVDASGLKGALNLTAGKDVLADNASIKGGSGVTDTLTLDGDVTGGAYVMTGVEKLAFAGASAANFSALNSTGLNTVALTSTAAGDKTVTNLGTASMLVEVRGTDKVGSVSLDHSGTTGINVLGATTGTTAVATAVAAGVTLANTSAIELNVADTAKYNGIITAGKATSASINVENTGEANANKVTFAGAATELVQINAASKGNLEIAATDLAKVKAVAVDTAGDFKLDVALAAANSVTVSGAGTALFNAIGAVGTAGDQTVTVSGLKATSALEAFKAGAIAMKGNTTLSASDLTGGAKNALDVGAVSSNDKAVTVTVNGATATSGTAVKVTSVTAATNATVTVNKTGATTGTAVSSGAIEATAGVATVSITEATAGATGTAVNVTGAITGGLGANVTVGAAGKVTLSGVTATKGNASLNVTTTGGTLSTGDVLASADTGAASVKVAATSTNPADNVTVGAVTAGAKAAATVDLSGTKLVANAVLTNGLIDVGAIAGKTGTLNLTDVTATKITVADIGATDAVTVNAATLVLAAEQTLSITATATKVLNFTGSTTANNTLVSTVSETATVVGGAKVDSITINNGALAGKTATVNVNVGAADKAADVVTFDAGAGGKLRATIDSFEGAYDKLSVKGLTVAVTKVADAGLAAATDVITQFLTSAGVTTSTPITNVFKVSAADDYLFQVNGATHVITNAGTAAGTFDDKDAFITLTGVTGLDSDASVKAFLVDFV